MNREAERKRLVELLQIKSCWYNDCETGCDKCGNVGISDTDIEKLADHLLDNDIVVPPCKVGEKVYHIRQTTCENIDGSYTLCEFYRHSGDDLCALPKGKCPHKYRIAECIVSMDNLLIVTEKWGKTVFLTREEAEKALEGSGEK